MLITSLAPGKNVIPVQQQLTCSPAHLASPKQTQNLQGSSKLDSSAS